MNIINSLYITQATKSLDLVAAEILASRQEVKMEDEEEDEKKSFIDIVLEETEVGPWIRIRIRIRMDSH
jgi:hypothetical protein